MKKIYNIVFWPQSVTLTLEVGELELHMTFRLIAVYICAKLFLNLRMDENDLDLTRNVCDRLTYLHFGGWWLSPVHSIGFISTLTKEDT